MAGIFSGQSSSPGGGLRGSMQGPAPRDFIGDQANALGPSQMWSGMQSMLNWQQAQKEKERLRSQYDNAIQSAPKDPYMEAMTAARAQADANSYVSGRKIGDAERTRQNMLGNTENWYGQLTGSNAPQFAHMLPAYQMHGIDVMGGRGTGWDQYAKLAGASPTYDPSAMERNKAEANRANVQAQGLQGMYRSGRF